MNKTIKIAELISTDIRSRRNADMIRDEINITQEMLVDLDMSGVVFISRSFADELLEITEKPKGKYVNIINSTGEVKSMLEVVAKSRKRKRIYPNINREMDVVKLKDMSSLKEFFATI